MNKLFEELHKVMLEKAKSFIDKTLEETVKLIDNYPDSYIKEVNIKDGDLNEVKSTYERRLEFRNEHGNKKAVINFSYSPTGFSLSSSSWSLDPKESTVYAVMYEDVKRKLKTFDNR